MSHPTSEPARGRRVNRAPVPRVGLFSHTLADVAEQRHPLVGDRVDWRATPFCTGNAAASPWASRPIPDAPTTAR